MKQVPVTCFTDITKKEWVLEGDTVNYLNWEDLRRAIDYDLEQERSFSYKGISQDAMITHLSRFVSGLWQIHAFGEKWDLRNRYLHINPSKEWREQPNLDTRTSNEQAPHKHPTSSPQVQDKLHTDDPNILRIVQAVGAQELSVKEIMDGMGWD